ncbi:MFS transporter [Spongisporangium articulatum]|uniref:MFS transporter n=1 Tax=Spongisporangium articulatum TaxID=3362603 RepID=A0ABW8AU42_9ACTN
MHDLSAQHRRAALLALALGGFAIGLTEFVAMGLLPDIAQDLLPGQYARSSSDAVAHAGWMITVYAAGVVVGAPTIAALSARFARKQLVLGLLAMFVAGTVLSALAPNFGLVLVARFLAALPHGAYFGAAGMLAATLIGKGSEAKGFAAVLGGLTAANIVGVPAITALGQATSWRVAYLAIAGTFALTLAAVALVVPGMAPAPGGSPRAELSSLRSGQVWLVSLVASIGFAGFFCAYSYIAPVTTHLAGLSASTVPWVLVVMGCGMTLGNLVGGVAADHNLKLTLLGGLSAIIASLVLFALTAGNPVGVFVSGFAVAATSLFVAPALQARLISVAPQAQLMGAAMNQSATNIANSLGAALGGATIAAGFGYRSPAVVGIVLGLVGLGLAAVSFRVERTPTDPVPEAQPAAL